MQGNALCAESLEVQGWRFRTSEPVLLPRLRRLALEDCRFEASWWGLTPSPIGLIDMFGLQPAALQTLHVQCCLSTGGNWSEAGTQLAAGLFAFSRLTSLSFAGSCFINDAIAAEAGGLAAIAHLDLSTPHACRLPPCGRGRGHLPPAAATALLAGSSRGGLRSSLRSLTLRGQAELDDAAVAALSALTALTRLDLGLPGTGWDSQLGDGGVQALGRGLTNLRVLRIGECRLAQRGCAALGRLTSLTGALTSVAVKPNNDETAALTAVLTLPLTLSMTPS